jgi:Uncharacterized conserved protein (DUF2190)
MANDAINSYEPNTEITCFAQAAVTGKRFVVISGNKLGAVPGTLDSTASGGNIQVSPAAANGRIFGVAAYDAAINTLVRVIRAPGVVTQVTAEASLTAGQEVAVGAAAGAKVAASTQMAVGFVIADCANGADAQVCLYSTPRVMP